MDLIFFEIDDFLTDLGDDFALLADLVGDGGIGLTAALSSQQLVNVIEVEADFAGPTP